MDRVSEGYFDNVIGITITIKQVSESTFMVKDGFDRCFTFYSFQKAVEYVASCFHEVAEPVCEIN